MATKTNETAVRALEVLKLLSFEEKTQEEIIKHIFNAKKSDYELRTDSLYKYLNTFKMFGINVIRNKGKYTLSNLPLNINLTEKEIETIKVLYSYSQEVCPENTANQFKLLLKNLLKCSNQEILLEETEIKNHLKKIKLNTNKENIEKFSLLCKEKQRISFLYQNRVLNKTQKFIVEPIEVIAKPTGEILKAFNPDIAENQNFQIEEITELKQLPIMVKSMSVKNAVTFELKGRLALAYELKNGERVIKREKNSLIVSSSEEDKEELLKRLLRYGVSCEILYPKVFKERFFDLIDRIKSVYKEYEDTELDNIDDESSVG